MAKKITALNRVIDFCNENNIQIGLAESQAQKDENTLVHIPGVKIIVSYKDAKSNPVI